CDLAHEDEHRHDREIIIGRNVERYLTKNAEGFGPSVDGGVTAQPDETHGNPNRDAQKNKGDEAPQANKTDRLNRHLGLSASLGFIRSRMKTMRAVIIDAAMPSNTGIQIRMTGILRSGVMSPKRHVSMAGANMCHHKSPR